MFDFLNKKKLKVPIKPGNNSNGDITTPDADEAIDEVEKALLKAENIKKMEERERLLEKERRLLSNNRCGC